MTLIWRSPTRVEIGGRFRAVAESRFHANGTVWLVERIYDGPDGRAHAVVINSADPTVRKTFSVNALTEFEALPIATAGDCVLKNPRQPR